MKNSAQILSHLKHQPQFSKLAQHECIRSVQKLFPPHLQKMILYGYIRNGILFFVFNHPGAKQEFDLIIESIKTPLRAYPPKTCQSDPFNDIKAFVTHKPLYKAAQKSKPELLYAERAEGTFTNPATDQRLHRLIEKIRQTIQSHHASTD
ncbi:MAG: hypothetical protein U9Q62_02545 [Campylobacterota bacterium]|nr:hypothetical protein [Campylobacterota bacterium]